MGYTLCMENVEKINKLIKDSKVIVLKFGTNSISSEDGSVDVARIKSIAEDISQLKKQGKKVIIVSSGAVSCGASILGIEKPSLLSMKQACAAIGQSKLMELYEGVFFQYGIKIAQLLLTEDDFSVRKRYLNLRNTINTLLELDILPIINQNDVVCSNELKGFKKDETIVCFGDNDKLSSLVMSELDGDLLVILSDIDGLYDDDPRKNENAKLIRVVEKIDEEIEKLGFSASLGGRGGMKTKIEAAKVAVTSGGAAVIINGKKENSIKTLFNEGNIGTIFLPDQPLSGKKRWIAYATNIQARIYVNEGAKEALIQNEASLLPIGIIKIKGNFVKGDVVSICDESGQEFAKGIVNYKYSDTIKIKGRHSNEIEEILGYKNYDAVITRDNIAILDK